jgi:lipoprotein-anchoring transpeptidase ErfK/SrfK
MTVPHGSPARSRVRSRRAAARPGVEVRGERSVRSARSVANAIVGGLTAALVLAAVVVPVANARDAGVLPSGLAIDDGATRIVAGTAARPAGAAVTRSAATAPATGPVPATPTRKAQRVPASPRDGGKGRRIVYDKALMYVWIVDANNRVVRRYPVTGRWDRPAKGTYRIYGKSVDSMNTHSQVTFRHMVRFAWGTKDETASIGFHSIPIYYARHVDRDGEVHAKGSRMTTRAQLGLPIATGGCVRQSDEDAAFLYQWSRIGDKVVVLPSP